MANGGHLLSNLLGPTTVRIAGTLSTGTAAQILPVAPQAAGNLVFYVSGASASIGAGSTVTALLSVPSGTLTMSDNVIATGAFTAKDFVAGNNVALGFQTGFPSVAASGTRCALNLQAEFPLPPVVPVQGVASFNAPFTFQLPAQIPVTSGSPAAGEALLSFAPLNSLPVVCTYGALGLPSSAFVLQNCTNGATAGSAQVAQSFTLQPIGSFNLSLGPIVLSVTLNAPSNVCDDLSLCTTDTCGTNGYCQNATSIQCEPSACQTGTCNPVTGGCTYQSKVDGLGCDDTACSGTGSCNIGACVCASPPQSQVVAPTALPPPPPRVPGCYVHTPNGWTSVACATQDVVDSLSPPEPELGLVSEAFDSSGMTQTQPLVYAQLENRFLQAASENDRATDGTLTANSWSIQNNTNKFTAPNGDQAWVQFVIQSVTDNLLCVWNIDLTTGDYHKKTKCLPKLPKRAGGFQRFDSSNVAGYVDATSQTITMVANLSWVPPTTTAPAPDGWAVVVNDVFGLAGSWTRASGTVFGIADSSRALFTDAEVAVSLAVSSCQGDTTAVSPTCPGQPMLQPHVGTFTSKLTGESVNLIRESVPSVGYLNADLAVANYVQSTSGACVADGYAFVKDNDDDDGSTPSNLHGRAFWESPDLLVVPHGAPVDVNTQVSETLVTPGQPYDAYVRVRNGSACKAVTGVKALVYLADPCVIV